MNAFKGTRQGIFFGMVAMLTLASFDASARSRYTSISISGTAPASVTAGNTYSFQPSVSGGYTARSFSIQNKPRWATFSTYTGKLSGTPSSYSVGTYSNIVISVTDGRSSARLRAFSVTVKAAATTAPAPTPTPTPEPTPVNTAPTISGTAPAQVLVGSAYQFTANGADANGDALTYSVTNLPTWATFNASTGTMSGTPAAANVGTYSNIVVSVSDGKGGSASLAAFSVNVVAITNGTATVSWAVPTQNTDGSALTNLAGYRVYYGTTRGGPYSKSIDISNTSVTRQLVENLTAGTHYFVVSARNTAGVESVMSAEVSKTIN